MIDRSVPASRIRLCAFCLDQVDSNAVGVYQLAHGWLQNRRKGGANTIALPDRKDVFACDECISKLKAGIPVGQMRLFGLTDET